MTKSTGAMAGRRRRGELFSAEMTLVRVIRHLLQARGWARRGGGEAGIEVLELNDAMQLCRDARQAVLDEAADLR